MTTIQDLHAAISRRSWSDVEVAANKLRDAPVSQKEAVPVGFIDPHATDAKSSLGEPLNFWCSPVRRGAFTQPLYASPVPAPAGEPAVKALPDDLLERLEAGVTHAGVHDDNSTELFNVDDASDTMWDAAQGPAMAMADQWAEMAEPVAVRAVA
jgi:hypothetical protein